MELAEILERDYGEKVKVEYFDAQQIKMEEHPGVEELVRRRYRFPYVFINGEARFAGGIVYPRIKDAVGEILGEEHGEDFEEG